MKLPRYGYPGREGGGYLGTLLSMTAATPLLHGSEGKVRYLGRQAWQAGRQGRAGSSDIHSTVPNVNNEQMRARSYVLNVSPT